jgi:hypothetical protein
VDGAAAVEVQVAEGAGRTSVWDDQVMVWVHALSTQRTGESPDGVEPDNAGVQPQTSVEPGKLRENDGGGGGESAANLPCLLSVAIQSLQN